MSLRKMTARKMRKSNSYSKLKIWIQWSLTEEITKTIWIWINMWLEQCYIENERRRNHCLICSHLQMWKEWSQMSFLRQMLCMTWTNFMIFFDTDHLELRETNRNEESRLVRNEKTFSKFCILSYSLYQRLIKFLLLKFRSFSWIVHAIWKI